MSAMKPSKPFSYPLDISDFIVRVWMSGFSLALTLERVHSSLEILACQMGSNNVATRNGR